MPARAPGLIFSLTGDVHHVRSCIAGAPAIGQDEFGAWEVVDDRGQPGVAVEPVLPRALPVGPVTRAADGKTRGSWQRDRPPPAPQALQETEVGPPALVLRVAVQAQDAVAAGG